jgi:Zn-dependent alcohol dehydrogenase
MDSSRFRLDVPSPVDFDLDGGLKPDERISSRIDLGNIHDAFDPLRKGDAARWIIGFDA